MDWQQKAAALNALCEINIKCRGPGDWYVSQRISVRDDSVLRGSYGNGATPEAAIADHWKQLVDDLKLTPMYLVSRPEGGKRRAVRWNGFMWDDVYEPDSAATAA